MSNYYYSLNEPGQYITIHLKGKRFKLSAITFLIINKRFPRRWNIEGSNDGAKWTEIKSFTSDDSYKVDRTAPTAVVDASERYSFFRINAIAPNFRNDNYFAFCSMEFFGELDEF
jgi:hypothetical protein